MYTNRITAAVLAGLCCLAIDPMPMPLHAVEIHAEEAAVWDGSIDTSWYDADAAELHISTPSQLAGMVELLADKIIMTGQTIILDADLVLNDTSDYENWSKTPPANLWEEIGSPVRSGFDGTFNGGGHTISGLYGGGLFGHLSENAKILDLHLTNAYLDIKSSTYSGGICMVNRGGSISGCSFDSATNANYSTDSTHYCGGICGFMENGSIENCKVSGELTSVNAYAAERSAPLFLGGICGRMENSTIRKCSSSMAITATSKFNLYIGGICGYSLGEEAHIIECANSGNIKGIAAKGASETAISLGGICAVAHTMTYLTNCYNLGEIGTKQYAGYYGGITGCIADAVLTSVYNAGTVSGKTHAGGILGYYFVNPPVTDGCYYLDTAAERGVGDTKREDLGTSESIETMQSKEFAQLLGDAYVDCEENYPQLAWETGNTVLLGDVNGDGTRSVSDAILLQKVLHALETLPPSGASLADLTQDGNVNGFDLAYLKRILLA